MTDSDDGITYIYPETTCDHCHVTIPKIETNASEMVFTRHRLAIVQNHKTIVTLVMISNQANQPGPMFRAHLRRINGWIQTYGIQKNV
jgi:CxxC motif-containing protein (DUF1111 family)